MSIFCIADGCKSKTNNPDRVCSSCRVKIRNGLLDEPPNGSAVKSDPATDKDRKTPNYTKTCEVCGNSYQAGGPRQKFCDSCATTRKQSLKDANKKAVKKTKKKTAKKKATTEHKTPQKPYAPPAEKFIPLNLNNAPESLMLNSSTVVINLALYPGIQEWITERADEEFRTPDMQVVSFLHDLKDLQNKQELA